MTREEILACCRSCRRVPGVHASQSLGETPGADRRLGEEIQCQFAELVVHRGVESVTLEPRHGVAHDLGDEVYVGFDALDLASEVDPEIVIDVAGYVHTPAVDVVLLHPVHRNIQEVLPGFGIRQDEAWHGGHPVPRRVGRLDGRTVVVDFGDHQAGGACRSAVVVEEVGGAVAVQGGSDPGPNLHRHRVFLDVEPSPVGGLRSLLDHILEGEEPGMAVIERGIEDDSDPVTVQ